MSYDRRAREQYTRLVHATTLEKSGHYDYTEYTACGRSTNWRGNHEPMFFDIEPNEPVTCLLCIGAMS